MDYKELYFSEYKRLFQEYKNEFESDKRAYLSSVGKNWMSFEVHSDRTPEFFKLEEEFKERMKKLNAPILNSSKYNIGDSVNVVKSGQWGFGKINRIKVSDSGSGELLYFLDQLPSFSGDYYLEKDIVGFINVKKNKEVNRRYSVMVEGKTSPTKFHDSYEVAEQEAIRLVNKENKPTYVLMAVSLVELNSVKVTSLTASS